MTHSVLITGASRGIGKAIALRLAALNYRLFLLARDNDALAEVSAACRDIGGEAAWLAGDLRSETYLLEAIEAAQRTYGQVDVLVNNAGTARHEAVQDADPDAWRTMMDLNFHSIAFLSRQLLPAMIERDQGAVVNISSINGRSTNAGGAIYCASKHALNAFTECLFEDVRDHSIKVSSIMPGFVATDMTGGLGMNSANMIRPEDVAEAVAFVLQSSASVCPTEIVLRPQKRL